MLYLIGLGLNEKSINLETLEASKKADKIYLENYTVDFPYKKEIIEKIIKKKIIEADRSIVESESIADEAKKKNVILLIYGSPLAATTHISLILKCKKEKIKYKVIQNSSIFDAIAETGLQLYKFGKTTSLPSWKENYKPSSFMQVILDNQKIKSHSIILVDIGLNFKQAIEQLKESSEVYHFSLDKIIICEKMGTVKQKIYYDNIKNLEKLKISSPYCFIIPSDLHHIEEEALNLLIK
jgi:diphthine synthase